MSPRRRVFCLSLVGLCLLWAVVALIASGTRFEYRNMIAAIRAGEEPPKRAALAEAVDAYHWALKFSPCNDGLHDDLTLLLGQGADNAAIDEDGADDDAALQAVQDELAAHLSCSPSDGKTWLDFASIDIHREGYTPRAAGAYRMSARVAPGESWLAEKRLLFALQFRPLLEKEDVRIATEDLAVLKRAHPNRMDDVRQLAGLENEAALYGVFGATPPKAE